MHWIWQHPDWPRFTWDAARLTRAEDRFLLGAGVFLGTIAHMGDADRDRLTVEAMGLEAVTTSEIEGELLDRDSVQSSIRHRLGLSTDTRRVRPAEHGIAEMMVDLFSRATEPLDEATLFAWHRMVMRGREDLRDVGRYRTHTDPMRVVSGPLHEPRVHFEAPPSARVPGEMRDFVAWFNRTAPDGSDPLPPLSRAAAAHLYFESIHPFEDGNGRIGRAISEKALSQGIGRPTLTALAATILVRRSEYYAALEAANKHSEITDWVAWFAGITLEAQHRAQTQMGFLLDKARFFDRLRGKLNERQEKVLTRVLHEGPEGFKGGLSAGNYVSIAKTSPATATRDLTELVDMGAMERTGERRHTRYWLTIPVRTFLRFTVDADGEVVVA